MMSEFTLDRVENNDPFNTDVAPVPIMPAPTATPMEGSRRNISVNDNPYGYMPVEALIQQKPYFDGERSRGTPATTPSVNTDSGNLPSTTPVTPDPFNAAAPTPYAGMRTLRDLYPNVDWNAVNSNRDMRQQYVDRLNADNPGMRNSFNEYYQRLLGLIDPQNMNPTVNMLPEDVALYNRYRALIDQGLDAPTNLVETGDYDAYPTDLSQLIVDPELGVFNPRSNLTGNRRGVGYGFLDRAQDALPGLFASALFGLPLAGGTSIASSLGSALGNAVGVGLPAGMAPAVGQTALGALRSGGQSLTDPMTYLGLGLPFTGLQGLPLQALRTGLNLFNTNQRRPIRRANQQYQNQPVERAF